MSKIFSQRLLVIAVFIAVIAYTTLTVADDRIVSDALQCEGAISAAQVKAGAMVFRYEAEQTETLTGFYVRLSNCVGPRCEPTVVGLRIGDTIAKEQVRIPVYGTPLKMFTRSKGGHVYPALDVGQEYRTALDKTITIRPGDSVTIEIVSTEPLVSGVTAGLQFAGSWPLLAMREPFRITKGTGPVSRIAWSDREVVCTGNQKKFDPLCAPQNNSGIVSDPDGSLFQFTAYYSVDEQYGGGRAGSFSRIYGFRKGASDQAWQPLGLIANPVPMKLAYCGDPFAFRDVDGKPCLVYTVADGTNGFIDWKHIGAYIIRSKTDSFSGPWGSPHAIFDGLPERRVICLRIYPRPKTNDYVIVWLDGTYDISNKAVIVPNLDITLSHEKITNAVTLTRNQEEGGGGFVRGDKGYLSTWQIPGINDPTSIQRLYEFDLYDPLNPEKWRVVPGSWGWNDGTNPIEDGGATADSWSLSYDARSDRLWATSVVWSKSLEKNSTLACSVPWAKRLGTTFQYGCPLVHREIAPVVEYAIGTSCSLSATVTATGTDAGIFLLLAPSQRPLFSGGVALEISGQGIRLAACSERGDKTGLTPYLGTPFVPGEPYRVRLQRDGYSITGWVNNQQIGPVAITDPAQKAFLDEPQRFKFYGWQGCSYSISDAVLVDGPSGKP